MNIGPGSWKSVLENPPVGAHLILWGDASDECAAALETFLRRGIARDDLVMLLLPREELAELEEQMRARDFDLDEEVRRGVMVRAASEDVAPRGFQDIAKVYEHIGAVRILAENIGKRGLTVLSRVAPLCFEHGEQEMAETIERIRQKYPGDIRTLCLYRRHKLHQDQFWDVVAVTKLHTHAITHLGDNRFIVETITPPVEVLVRELDDLSRREMPMAWHSRH